MVCAVILTISLGALAGCSIAKENTENAADGQLGKKDIQEDVPENVQKTRNWRTAVM